MGRLTDGSAASAPGWLRVGGTIAIGFHLFTLLALVLAAPSGPWTTETGGQDYFMAPQFAQAINSRTARTYLRPLRMTHNYHFLSNEPGHPTIELEVKLKDKDGKIIKELRLPDENASLPIRQRQKALLYWLAPDNPQMPPEGEKVAGVLGQQQMREFWTPVEGSDPANPSPMLQLIQRPEHLAPRDGPTFTPSPLAKLLVRAYARHLCRQHNAETAEIIRHTWVPIPPGVLVPGSPKEAFSNRIVHANFGEVKGE